MNKVVSTLRDFGINADLRDWQRLGDNQARFLHRLIILGAVVGSAGKYSTVWLLPDGRRLEIQSMSVRIV